MKKNKTIWIAAGALALLILISVIGKKAGWFGKEDALRVAVESVTKRTIVESVTASGKINPQTEVKLSSEVSGEVIRLLVKEGDSVKKGDLLCVINPAIYESVVIQAGASVNQSKANLAAAKANAIQMQAAWEQAKRQFERSKKLFEDKVISEAEYEAARLQYEQAHSNYASASEQVNAAEFTVKSAAAQLQQAQDNLQKTKIYAPIGGIVSLVNVKLGERVVGTAQMAGTELIRIADLDHLQVEVDVNENDVLRVSIGDSATVEVDAYPKKKFKAVVHQIAYSATNALLANLSNQATNFTVKLRMLPESYRELVDPAAGRKYPFRPGMNATVDITTEIRHEALSVPIQSVTLRDKNKAAKKSKSTKNDDAEREDTAPERSELEEVVFVVKDGKVQARRVVTGIQDNTYFEIKDGVKEGEEVVKAPFKLISKKLNDGDAVLVVPEDELFTDEEED
ncbi:MAG: efflux RND transporter periplasmic adaptor subunit [Chitinophagales bacterium]|nr:efflux RND transporter periplasmic adaptor subunit [Chitinophagales bacterium]MDW8417828.1 efflux RND transporter periplasmic adaptor subunit [Chitinophagales bacterium]